MYLQTAHLYPLSFFLYLFSFILFLLSGFILHPVLIRLRLTMHPGINHPQRGFHRRINLVGVNTAST